MTQYQQGRQVALAIIAAVDEQFSDDTNLEDNIGSILFGLETAKEAFLKVMSETKIAEQAEIDAESDKEAGDMFGVSRERARGIALSSVRRLVGRYENEDDKAPQAWRDEEFSKGVEKSVLELPPMFPPAVVTLTEPFEAPLPEGLRKAKKGGIYT